MMERPGAFWSESLLLVLRVALALTGGCNASKPAVPEPALEQKTVTPKAALHLRRVGFEKGAGPIALVLHGFGAPGDDLVPVAARLSALTPYRFVLPEAPIGLPQGGRAWWLIDFAAREQQLARGEGLNLRNELPAGLPTARAKIEALLQQVGESYGVPRRQIALVGFSQGAMLSMDVLLRGAEPVACVALLSGSFIAEKEWRPRLASRKQVPLFMSHGEGDPVLPFATSVELRDLLRQEGYSVRFHPFHGGHGVPLEVVHELAAFLKTCAGAAD